MANCKDDLLQDEISALQAIYLPEELEVKNAKKRPCEILATLHPYTADNEDEKYVQMQLVMKVYSDYPLSKPSFDIRMPRGISDHQIDSILENLDGLASHRLGEEMLFTLIEYAKECLTNNNKPECPCAICLDIFEESDNFIRTECFHFFHDVCIARYMKSYAESMESETNGPNIEGQKKTNLDLIPCPVCRTDLNKLSLKVDSVDTDKYISENIPFEPSAEFLAWRKRMRALFRRQQKRGGIIDIEAEKRKFLIETKTEESREPGRVEGNDEDERTHVIRAIDDWMIDDSSSAANQSQAVRKSVPSDKDVAPCVDKTKSFTRKEQSKRTDKSCRPNWKPSEGRKCNSYADSCGRGRDMDMTRMKLENERQLALGLQRTNIGDFVDREKTGSRNKDNRRHVSSPPQPRQFVSAPPGFKPIR